MVLGTSQGEVNASRVFDVLPRVVVEREGGFVAVFIDLFHHL